MNEVKQLKEQIKTLKKLAKGSCLSPAHSGEGIKEVQADGTLNPHTDGQTRTIYLSQYVENLVK